MISFCDNIYCSESLFLPSEEATKLHSQDEQFHRRVKELTAMVKKTTELTDTTVALAQVDTHTA